MFSVKERVNQSVIRRYTETKIRSILSESTPSAKTIPVFDRRPIHKNNAYIEINEDAPFSIEYDQQVAQIRIQWPSFNDQSVVKILRALAEKQVSFDMVVIEPGEIRFTSPGEIIKDAAAILEKIGYRVKLSFKCAKIYLRGGDKAELSRIMAAITQGLESENIPTLQITESCGTILILLEERYLKAAIDVLSQNFKCNDAFCYTVEKEGNKYAK